MPYASESGKRTERAHPAGHVPTIHNDLVRERLSRYQSPQRTGSSPERRARVASLLHPAASLAGSDRNIQFLIAVDGSAHEQEIDANFPSTRTLFLQVAGVLVDLDRLRTKTPQGFADPAAQLDAQDSGVFAGFLPGSNLISVDGDDPVRAFRREVHTLMSETDVNGRYLLDILDGIRSLVRDDDAGDETKRLKCPGCRQGIDLADLAKDGAPCLNPSCDETLWLTDALRLHEAFAPYESNMSVATRTMLILEHLTLLAFGRFVLAETPAALGSVAFIADGPLALFGEPSRWRRPLIAAWHRLADVAVKKGLRPPLVIGIEKSGAFVEHARALGELLPAGCLMEMPVDYIAEYINFKNTNYGVGNYYGRKFAYCTIDARIVVFSVPPLGKQGALPYGPGGASALADYPMLGATCRLLDQIGTRLYDDAVIPLALAHKWASYPLRTAGSVLKVHAKEHFAAASPP